MPTHKDEKQFWDDFMDVVDGDPEALDAYADLLADSEALRDARFEAEQAVRRLTDAGVDWNPPGDLEEQIIATIEAQGGSSEATTTDERAGAAGPSSDAPVDEPTREKPEATTGSATPTRPRPIGLDRKHLWVAAVVLSAAAAVALAFAGASLLDDEGATGTTAVAALSARVELVQRAADDEVVGLELRRAGAQTFEPATPQTEAPPGATLRTDDRTRAQLALSDGSTVFLNHDTEITLGTDAPRQLRLAAGELIADVAHLESGPHAQLVTPNGRVEVLGTKLVVNHGTDSTSVRVVRGAVLAHGLTGAPVEVKAGEEGVLAANASALVAPATNLARTVAWSELDSLPSNDNIPGIGQLRARRPGENEDQERPLSLAEHSVEVRIAGNVARTEVEQTFRNDGPHTLEGIYRFPLPPDAQIASLSLLVDGEWQQGAFVSRDRGQRIWRGVIRNATPRARRARREEFVWVPGPWRDPALLEWQRGNQFDLRIFPIPARGARSIRLAYTQTISPIGQRRRYVYPLPHSGDDSTRVGRFRASVRISGADGSAPPEGRGYAMRASTSDGATRLEFTADDFVPAGDLAVDFRLPNEAAGIRWWTWEGDATVPPSARQRRRERDVADAQRDLHGDARPYVVFALSPQLPVRARADARDYVLVLDSSQSMFGEPWARATRLAARMVAEMDRRDRFVVLTCDATCETPEEDPSHPSAQVAARLEAWLEGIRPAGSSDVVSAMRAGVGALDPSQRSDRITHVMYIGDGMGSVGHRRPSSVAAEVRALAADDPRLTVSTVGIGSDADALMLRAVARAGGGHHVPYVPGQRVGAAALAALETTFGSTLEGATLRLPEGVVDMAPAQLPAIRGGEEVLVVGRLSGSDEVTGDIVLSGKIGDQPFEERYPVRLTPTSAAGNAFVPSLWATRTIEELELEGKPADQPRIVALSKAYGVMSRHTSLLVLESEAMFRAFGVDRAQERIQWSGDEEAVGGRAERSRSEGVSEAASLGQIDGRGVGRRVGRGGRSGGGGSLHGTGSLFGGGTRMTTRRAEGGVARRRSAVVRQSAPNVSGSLSREVILRVIRRHQNAIRYCYERELQRQPSLQGRVHVQLRISATGQVGTARITSSTMRNARVEGCIVRQVRRWRFPAPAGGGSVVVTYPFIFSSSGSGASVRPPTPPPVQPSRRAGQWMRRETYRVGVIHSRTEPVAADGRRAREAQTALREMPDSRDRHRALARARSRSGEVKEAIEAVEDWMQRDQLDPEALTLLSDLVGREGERLLATRLLSGIVDLQPNDTVLQERLARAFERAGMHERACAHRVALAEISAQDPEVVSAAVRCERALERPEGAARLLAAISDEDVRERAGRLAGEPRTAERVRVRSNNRGHELTLDASWEGDTDVDLSLVTPQGTRISWLGGRRTVVGEHSTTVGRERLGLRRATRGSYLVEVSRVDPDDETAVEGRIAIQLLGEVRTIPFSLDAGVRQSVARLTVERRTRLVAQ